MALRLGALYVSLSADTNGFIKSLAEAGKRVERFAKEIKKTAKDVSEVGTALAAVGGVALKLASEVDGPTKTAMDGLTRSTKQLAVPVAQMLLPAVRALTEDVQALAGWVSGLDPAIKANVSTFVKWAVEIGVAAVVIGKVAGAASTLAGIFSGVAGALAALGVGSILPFVVGLAAIAGGVALVHKVWRENWGGIQEVTKSVLEWLGSAFGTWFEWFGKAWRFALDVVKVFVDNLLTVGDAIEAISGKDLGMTGIHMGVDGLFKDLGSGEAFKMALEFGKSTGQAIGDGIATEWKSMLGGLWDTAKGFFAKKGPLVSAMPQGPISSGALALSRMGRSMMSATAPHEAGLTKAELATQARFAAGRAGGGMTSVAKSSQLDVLALAAASAAAFAAEMERVAGGLKHAGQMLLSKMGSIGELVGSAVQGFEAGGPMGAALAVVADFITRTAAFGDLVAFANDAVQKTADALSPLIAALTASVIPIVEGSMMVTRALLQSLGPAFEVLGTALRGVGPLFQVVAALLALLAPVLALLFAPLKAVAFVLDGAMRVIYEVLRQISLGLLLAARQILFVWNAMMSGLAGIVDEAIDAITLGVVKDGGSFIRKFGADMTGIDSAIFQLKTTSYDAAAATTANAMAQSAAAKAVSTFSESLTNIPSGFKVAAAQFGAMEPLGGGGAAFAGAGGGDTFIEISNLQVQTDDPVELMRGIKAQSQKLHFRKKGNRFGGSP